ncbi:hypothetical protein MKW92_023858 [Papaver armeniacum]|nr:hypothetical protein MKW92_023858 [Papaver armeniacum]
MKLLEKETRISTCSDLSKCRCLKEAAKQKKMRITDFQVQLHESNHQKNEVF